MEIGMSKIMMLNFNSVSVNGEESEQIWLNVTGHWRTVGSSPFRELQGGGTVGRSPFGELQGGGTEMEGRKERSYLTTHSSHFIDVYMEGRKGFI